MKISMIAAMAQNRVIGSGGRIPWHIPEDFKYFKAKTIDKPIIMGRKTFESLPGVLPKRVHKVVTRNREYEIPKGPCEIYLSLEDAIKSHIRKTELFIIGGEEIYKEALRLDVVDTIYLTVINTEFYGDAFFPEIDENKFGLISADPGKDTKDDLPYEFRVYKKICGE